MQKYHCLGALSKISETLWYAATFAGQWVALLSFPATALKCSERDREKRDKHLKKIEQWLAELNGK
jgi:hypothetical protein